jgi:ATP-binding cassette subfamily B protein
LSTLLAIYYGGLLTYKKIITPGDIVAFIFYINMLTWPFASVGWVTSIIQRASASQERINEFLKIIPSIQNQNQEKLDDIHSVEFKNVSFQYAENLPMVLKDISFKVKKGERIGFIGRTGSGKSTLLHLLMRQIDPTSGDILLNSVSLKNSNLDGYRQFSGVVPQEVFLFSDTIKNNISFGKIDGEVTEEELISVTTKAHVLHNIESFPNKFETLLGERGVNLSGGQKQRISIARALIRKPKLLVLDDCLSAVDTETEDIILNGIAESTKDQITIIVSHRISSLRFVDKIYVIEDGEIKEQGSQTELLALKGIYADMYEKQLKEDWK